MIIKMPRNAKRYPRRPRRITRKPLRKRRSTFVKKVQGVVRSTMFKQAEQKYVDGSITGQNVAQLNANASGHNSFSLDFPQQGDAFNQRIGYKINLSYLLMKFQFWPQTALKTGLNLYIYVVKFKGPMSTATFDISEMWLGNQAIADANAGQQIYDVRHMKNLKQSKPYSIIKRSHVYLPPQQVNNVELFRTKNVYVPLHNTSVLFSQGTDIDPANCEYRIITIADSGNRSGSTASTLLGVPEVGINTGALFNVSVRLAYKDI